MPHRTDNTPMTTVEKKVLAWYVIIIILLTFAALILSGCSSGEPQSTSPGPIVGRVGNMYIIREFKLENNVHCYTNGESISCLQLQEIH